MSVSLSIMILTPVKPVIPSVKDVRVSPAVSFKEMTENSKRYLQASGEWELVLILGDADILKFGIDEWDIITFWVRKKQ